jgi:threonine 3-dehydrogenase
MNEMHAVVKMEPGTGAEYTTRPIPEVRDDEVLIKVLSTSICGSDLHLYNWDEWSEQRVQVPRIMGHEMAGEVVEVGKAVRSFKVGDYVSAETHIYCGYCYACRHGRTEVCMNLQIIGFDRDGAFAEYVSLPERVIWKNDPGIPREWASIQEPLGNAVDTVLAENPAGKTVLVTGCGPVGLLAIGVARATGATTIFATDINEYRLELALKMGANFILNPKKVNVVEYVLDATHGAGVELLLEMSGSVSALRDGLRLVTPGGAVSLLGLFPNREVSLDLNNDVILKGIRVHGITGRKIFSTWFKTSRLLASGKLDLDPVITHRFPMAEFEKGLQLMREGLCGKILLLPPSAA